MNDAILRRKVLGCFLGKAVGGTLGMPFEGIPGTVELDFYDPVPTDMLPNDDLDLQVLWACKLAEAENPVIDRDLFAQAWLEHVNFSCDEYGVCIRNLRNGLVPPWTGSFDNWFVNGMGAAIRSELWACLAPGDPVLAARYAYEDACTDHTGDGLYAELFLAALESMAFVENDIEKLIAAGLAAIPADAPLDKAIRETVEWTRSYRDWRDVSTLVKQKYANENFTDVVPNLSFIVMALLLGNGDFGKTICLAVNCGLDTDCTGATAGSIMGILTPDGIGERWLAPIGRKLLVSKEIVGINPPPTLDGFVDLVLELKKRIKLRERGDAPRPDFGRYQIHATGAKRKQFYRNNRYENAPPMPEDSEELVFPGTIGAIASSRVPENGAYLLKFHFYLHEERRVKVLFSTHSVAQGWVDGKFSFARYGGELTTPSFHRAALNTYGVETLAAGKHELLVAVAPYADEAEIRWTLGIGDFVDGQWVADAFYVKNNTCN